MNKEYFTVSDINKIVKSTIDSSDILRNVYLKGEISNMKYHGRGHLYFSLKDESSKINAVMFNYSGKLQFEPKDGDGVLVRGRVSVYEASGSYQIYVDEMDIDGLGNLYLLFEQLKLKLSKEGLFDEAYKKPIPKIPKRIGIITASTGAAVRDIISTINDRYPLVDLVIFPTLVQGEGAKENIVRMIRLANEKMYKIDTIILGRGGGSIEDLWAFNEEIVARAIFESRVPIISAVGHEIDFTISDFVADKRAPTPTGGAQMAVPDKRELKRYLINARDRLNISIDNKLFNYNELLKKFKSNYLLNNPNRLYEMKEQRLNTLNDKLISVFKNILVRDKNKIDTLKIKLELLNPLNILDKGYSMVIKDNKVIKNIEDINVKDDISIVMSGGKVIANVKDVNKK